MTKQTDIILLAHGDGGLLTHQLLEKYFLPCFRNDLLAPLSDAALFKMQAGSMAVTTDAFVVDPIFFPGGDIGKLAICGTVNDLAVSGAKPLYLTASFIIEEGFALADLERIIASMADTCREAGVSIIAGDTKVVGRGQADKIFITTTGVGHLLPEADVGYHRIEPGDIMIINGPLGNHGLSILLARESFSFKTKIYTDCAPLNGVTEALLKRFRGIKFMRDLTRGGLATNAKETAVSAMKDIRLDAASIPVDDEVKGVCETLGLDPLYLANEGKFLAIVSEKEAGPIVAYLREQWGAGQASVIGRVDEGRGDLYLKTGLGGTRRLQMLAGAPLPRIC
ncbi:MAG: Hydrogenase expression/formation protein HypE [Syntrophorhabdus sp. PtaU1.Bin058]|nr:MAG: Hydrogenase expression/formation protein HypE [Syntrophorhabdus sp. PtaU1.Bin058]